MTDILTKYLMIRHVNSSAYATVLYCMLHVSLLGLRATFYRTTSPRRYLMYGRTLQYSTVVMQYGTLHLRRRDPQNLGIWRQATRGSPALGGPHSSA